MAQHNWGYTEDLIGPDEWPKHFKTGQYQSPINILLPDCCDRFGQQQSCCKRDEIHETRRLPERMRLALRLSDKRRVHLDSEGETHQRSSSASSSASGSRSPVGRESEEDERSDDERESFESSKRRCKQLQLQQQKMCQVQNTRRLVSHKKIFLGYPRYLSSMSLCNTGHNWQVNLPPELATHTRK